MKPLSLSLISGKEVVPLVEGGKGISISNGGSAGAWAAAGGVGTFSAANADSYDQNGEIIPQIYRGKTRAERHKELIEYAIAGGVHQARIAYETACNRGRIHMNVLWEMGGVEEVLKGVLKTAGHCIHGITCGAGMPYELARIAASFKVFYLPIVSSARAFRALWKRAYSKFSDWLGGVVYEDPWYAGGHNGLSNQEDPLCPQDPYPRVLALREIMREYGLHTVPIVMAGNVWYLREWEKWIDNEALGPIAFQLGTRPLLTQESPISLEWKKRLLDLKPGDILLNRFSPTGFYSSAVKNQFLRNLMERSGRQVVFSSVSMGDHAVPLDIGVQRPRWVYVTSADFQRCQDWMGLGFSRALKTPDGTIIFVTPEEAHQIHQDQVECMGCLSACLFSNWSQSKGTTGYIPDPRSFCIQKTLQSIAHGGSTENNLMFCGAGGYRFSEDPFYAEGFIPTVKELIDRLLTGD